MPQPRSLPHVFARVFNAPLAISPSRLDPLLAGLRAASLQRGSQLSVEIEPNPEPAIPPEIDVEIDWDRSTRRKGYMTSPQGVAWLPIRGVMVKREGEITADSTELESYARVGNTLRATMADTKVKAVLLEIDSPGGEVGGLFELASDIKTASRLKPIWAIANDSALSAGYAIASAAGQLWITKVAAVGSIGVVAMHTDQSAFDAAVGLVYTYIYAGQHKVEGNAHEPLSDDAMAGIQQEVDRLYGMFVSMVATNRPALTAEAISATEAAVFYGPHAINMGLADRVGTLTQAVTALGDFAAGRNSMDKPTTGAAADTAVVVAEPAAAAGVSTIEQVNNIVRLDQVRQVTSQVYRDTKEIAALCKTFNMMDLVGEYLNAEASVETVRADLLRRRAAADEARVIEAIDTTPKPGAAAAGGVDQSEFSKVMAARWASQMGRA